MTVHPLPGAPEPDEPAVRHPGLQVFVDAARAQPAPRVQLDADALHAAWLDARRRRRRRVGTIAAAAVAVLGLALLAPRLWTTAETHDPATMAEASTPAPAPAPAPAVDAPAPEAEAIEHERAAEPATEPVRLAEGIEVEPTDDTRSHAAEVLGPHRLRLPEGSWSVRSEVDEAVEVVLPDGALELRGGHVQVVVAGDVARVEVVRDAVIRIDRAGQRTVLTAPAPIAMVEDETPAPAPRERPSAEALAAQAEAHLIAGDRGRAIASLRQLVTTHPRSATARTALIDLGRLLRAAGRTDEARCAYRVFLERWPAHALAGDVRRAASALGEGPACKGLRPID